MTEYAPELRENGVPGSPATKPRLSGRVQATVPINGLITRCGAAAVPHQPTAVRLGDLGAAKHRDTQLGFAIFSR
jgi:hypothetical protein